MYCIIHLTQLGHWFWAPSDPPFPVIVVYASTSLGRRLGTMLPSTLFVFLFLFFCRQVHIITPPRRALICLVGENPTCSVPP